MKLRRQQIMRMLLGLVLVVAAAFCAAVIRNALAQRDPQNALPVMTIIYTTSEDSIPLPADIVRRDKYDWRFMFWTRSGGGKDLNVWQEIKVSSWVAPNSSLEMRFSFEPKDVQVKVLVIGEDGQSTFMDYPADLVSPDNPAQIIAPGNPGDYVLQVNANWGNGRDITYYAKVSVPE